MDTENLKHIDSKDEYTIIARAFKRITSEQQLMNEQLKNRKNGVKELYLLDLIKGNVEKYKNIINVGDFNTTYVFLYDFKILQEIMKT